MTKTIEDKLRKQVVSCLSEHDMLENGDHVMVGLSGGKDSWALLYLLKEIQKKSPIRFTLSALTLDGGLVGLDPSELQRQCDAWDVPFVLERRPVFEVVAEKKDPKSTFCSMCAKMRRGILYDMARKQGATKIALGHHLDDALETLFLNLFYTGQLSSMPPVLKSHSGHVDVLRPLLYCNESDIETLSAEQMFVTVGCACPVCPVHPDYDEDQNDLKRGSMKQMIKRLSLQVPGFHDSARRALRNVKWDRFFVPLGAQLGKTTDQTASVLPVFNPSQLKLEQPN